MQKITIERPDKAQLKELKIESWSPWECGVETFPWQYSGTEVAYVKEGRVKVTTEWEEVEIGPGDLVTFPDGLKCTWEVIQPIKKVYTFR